MEPLLERDAPLALLNDVLARVCQRSTGACVLLQGEAGVGKTSLVQAFLRGIDAAEACALVAGCEHLYTPRPLGPLVDLADRFPPSVARMLHEGSTWNGLFPALLARLRDARPPVVLAIEDMHWADDATLDLVRYLGRRLHDVPALLLLSYRNDELDAEHPLRRVLGELPATITRRVSIERLSVAAVRALAARRGRSARGLHEATGGNPFYVTELLAAPADAEPGSVPPSVADAVLGRLARLGTSARELAERVSLFPQRADVALLRRLAPYAADDADQCLQHGLLVRHDDSALAFRHELAREAVHQALPPHRRAALHAAVYALLREAADADDDAAIEHQLHHAESARLTDELLRLAPRAAKHAAASGGHREAARLYALALQHGASLPPVQRVELLEARALACAMTSRHGEAIRARREALQLRRDAGDRRGQGVNLHWLARLHAWSDSVPAAFDYARQAIDVLEALPPDGELAVAYSTLAHLCLIDDHIDDARTWSARAIALAQQVDSAAALSQALNVAGCARLRVADDASAWQMLERALELALAARLETQAALAYNNLHIMSLVQRRFEAALAHAGRGIAYCEANGIDVFSVRLRVRRAFALMQTGRWSDAQADLDEVRAHHRPAPMEQAACDFVRGLLELRRGDDGAAARLLTTCAHMQQLGVRIWFTSIAAAQAEVAWLAGDADAVQGLAGPELERALAAGDGWRAGELLAWLHRAGRPWPHPVQPTDVPHALEAQGRAAEAAACWQRIGGAYEHALVLGCSDDAAAMLDALRRLDQLGAGPAAVRVRERLRARGVRGIPRGAAPSTRSDPLGLTGRERAVFERLLRGQSNAGIATALHRSTRTVEHHVAAVYAKLGVSTRAELLAAFASAKTTPPARANRD